MPGANAGIRLFCMQRLNPTYRPPCVLARQRRRIKNIGRYPRVHTNSQLRHAEVHFGAAQLRIISPPKRADAAGALPKPPRQKFKSHKARGFVRFFIDVPARLSKISNYIQHTLKLVRLELVNRCVVEHTLCKIVDFVCIGVAVGQVDVARIALSLL